MKRRALLRRHHLLFAALIGLLLAACRPAGSARDAGGRYIVTAKPLNIGVGSGRFCIATDPTDAHGVWWWEPGPTGCASRSTGPTVFHAENAAVSPSTHAGATDIRFRVQLHGAPDAWHPPFVDVRLVLDAEGGRIRALATGAQVAAGRRMDLDVPEAWR